VVPTSKSQTGEGHQRCNPLGFALGLDAFRKITPMFNHPSMAQSLIQRSSLLCEYKYE
jgi:hypothetical protein